MPQPPNSPVESDTDPNCPLCLQPGGTVIWSNRLCRVIDAHDAHYPGLTRVIWQDHVSELTDLDAVCRDVLMSIVYQVEYAMRVHLAPDKINLACLGNQVPHLHWHIIPRWRDDATFPDPIWAPVKRDNDPVIARRRHTQGLMAGFYQALHTQLSQAS